MENILETSDERTRAERLVDAVFDLLPNVHPDEVTELFQAIHANLKPEVWIKGEKRDACMNYMFSADYQRSQKDAKYPMGRYWDDERKMYRSMMKNAKIESVSFNYIKDDGSQGMILLKEIVNKLISITTDKKEWNKMLKAFAKSIAYEYTLRGVLKHKSVYRSPKKNEYLMSAEAPFLNVGANWPISITSDIKPTLVGPLKNAADLFEWKIKGGKMPKPIEWKVAAILSAVPKAGILFNGTSPTVSYKILKQAITQLTKGVGTTMIMPQYPMIGVAYMARKRGGRFGEYLPDMLKRVRGTHCVVGYGVVADAVAHISTDVMMGTVFMDNGIRVETTGKAYNLTEDDYDIGTVAGAWPEIVLTNCWAGPEKGGRKGTSQCVGMNCGVRGIHASEEVSNKGFEAFKRLKQSDFGAFGTDDKGATISAIQNATDNGFDGKTVDGKTFTYKLQHEYVRSKMFGKKTDPVDKNKIPPRLRTTTWLWEGILKPKGFVPPKASAEPAGAPMDESAKY